MIDPKPHDVGRLVVYKTSWDGAQVGRITSYNEAYVFVRYGQDQYSKGTRREDLDWRYPTRRERQ